MEAKYDFISTKEVQGLLPVMKNDKWGLVRYEDYDMEVVRPVWNAKPEEERFGFIKTCHNGNYGLLNSEGKEILPPIYKKVYVESKNRIVAFRVDDRWAILNELGEEIIPFNYESLDYFSDDIILACKDDKWGVITIKKDIVIPFKYEDLELNEEKQLLVVRVDSAKGVINIAGEEIVPCEFDEVYLYPSTIFVSNNQKMGAYHYNGELIIEPRDYDCLTEAMAEYKEMFVAKISTLEYLINIDEEFIGDNEYRKIHPFVNGYASVKSRTGQYGFIDSQGNEICDLVYTQVRNFKNKRAAVKTERLWGFIGMSGIIKVRPIYDCCGDFENGYAIVCKDNKCTIIDEDGKEILPRIYDEIKFVKDNEVHVVFNGEEGIVRI